VELTESLVQQGHLLRRDGAQIEEAVLRKLDQAGAWK
jgi:hypothetical protein